MGCRLWLCMGQEGGGAAEEKGEKDHTHMGSTPLGFTPPPRDPHPQDPPPGLWHMMVFSGWIQFGSNFGG